MSDEKRDPQITAERLSDAARDFAKLHRLYLINITALRTSLHEPEKTVEARAELEKLKATCEKNREDLSASLVNWEGRDDRWHALIKREHACNEQRLRLIVEALSVS